MFGKTVQSVVENGDEGLLWMQGKALWLIFSDKVRVKKQG